MTELIALYTPDQITKGISVVFDIKITDLSLKRKGGLIGEAINVRCYLLYNHCISNKKEVARLMECSSSTAWDRIEAVNGRYEFSKEFRSRIEKVKQYLNNQQSSQ